MNNVDIRSLYGLKYNPFLPDVPPESLFTIPGTEQFIQRVQAMASQGGFALITGDPGLGKSKTLQSIAYRLEKVPDLVVGVMQRPQSALGDFYRELGELFNVGLSPANRYGGFKAITSTRKTFCLLSFAVIVGYPNDSEPQNYCPWGAVSDHGLRLHHFLLSNCKIT